MLPSAKSISWDYDDNTNEDEATLTLRKGQKVNLFAELIHSPIDFSIDSVNEINEPKTTATPSKPLTKHKNSTPIPSKPWTKYTPQTIIVYSSSHSDTNTLDEMFETTLVENLVDIWYRSIPYPRNTKFTTSTPSPFHYIPPLTPNKTTSPTSTM